MKHFKKTHPFFLILTYLTIPFLLSTSSTYNHTSTTDNTASLNSYHDPEIVFTTTTDTDSKRHVNDASSNHDQASVATQEPLLVIVLMVKNEASVIRETLQPFVDGGAKYFVIFDTGSTDGTQTIVQNFFVQHDITNFHIVEEPFINFAASRNRALEVTQHLFPRAHFMIMPDAEWYMHNVEKLLDFCNSHKTDDDSCYFVPIRNTAIAFVTARLIRCHKNVHFVGVVHEILNASPSITLPDDCYFEWRPSTIGQEKSAQRWKRDRGLLLEEHIKNPNDPRTTFYLAQTYDCLGDHENAYTYYKKRTLLPGPNEDHFITLLRLGTVAENLATY